MVDCFNVSGSSLSPAACSDSGAVVVVPYSVYTANPFNVSLSDAVVLGDSIALVLSVAFIFRLLFKSLHFK